MDWDIEDLLASGAVVPDRPGSKRLVPAAPAPSSLAGGWLIREADGGWMWTGARIAATAALTEGLEVVSLAALSPEAPAREGETWNPRQITPNDIAAILDENADCHEEGGGLLNASQLAEKIWRAGLAAQEVADLHAKDAAERVHKNGGCVPQMAYAPILFALQDALTPRHEAPAEGAGEDLLSAIDAFMPSAEVAFLWSKETPPDDEVQRYRERYWAVKEALLRARSSAPEAREEGAVATVVRGGFSTGSLCYTERGQHADLPDGTLLFTHPAAPSADKLRIAVEALERARWALYSQYVEWDGEPEDAVPLKTAVVDCDQALATLKAESA